MDWAVKNQAEEKTATDFKSVKRGLEGWKLEKTLPTA